MGEIWGVYDEVGGWRRNAIHEVIWTFDRDEAKEIARRCHLDEFDSVKQLSDIEVAQISEAAEALIRYMKITQLRYELYERPKRERWEK